MPPDWRVDHSKSCFNISDRQCLRSRAAVRGESQ